MADAHPHYWAAFVMTGDGLRPIPSAMSWRALAASALILGMVVLLTIRWTQLKRFPRGAVA